MNFESQNQIISGFKHLELLANQVVEGFISGMHKSPFHGFSAEFAEHKVYNSGESTKHIDWKLFAKTDRLYTKRFEEDTNLRCHIIIDNSSSMHYPKLEDKEKFFQNKIGFSVLASAVLMNILKKQRDAVGLSITTLQGLNAQSKSLLIFSDGNDNDSDPNLTPVLLATRMTTDPKSVKIASFSIGLKGKGDLDENVLKTLSVNGGTSAFPKNSTELEKVFQDFSKTIASAYTLTYHRNQQIITQGNKRVIKFEIEADIK